uniref:Uncharacterized protein n=1 Tax=Steinernema glaseri TaxID=37863 RepID=A0A1I7ZQV8_9BILA
MPFPVSHPSPGALSSCAVPPRSLCIHDFPSSELRGLRAEWKNADVGVPKKDGRAADWRVNWPKSSGNWDALPELGFGSGHFQGAGRSNICFLRGMQCWG